jgi:hypothetical protein
MSTPDDDHAKAAAEELIKQMEAILQPGAASALAAESNTVLATYLNQTSIVCTTFSLVHRLLGELYSEEFLVEVCKMLAYRFWPHPTDFTTDQLMVLRDMNFHQQQIEETGDGTEES